MAAEQDVMAAAAGLIDAFARNDRDRYFSYFAPEATFIFYATDRVLESRAVYEAEWDLWVRDFGWRVIACVSSHQLVKIYGDMAIFTHQTVTQIADLDGEDKHNERETIIFQNTGGKWLAVHEHLSLLPETSVAL